MRRAAQRDTNEPAIIAALVKAGCLVQQVSDEGVPDLIVWSPHIARIVLLEVKDGAKDPSKRKLKPAQVVWHAAWAACTNLHIVNNIDDAYRAVGFKG